MEVEKHEVYFKKYFYTIMNTIQSVVIAIIEGLTEFLPISSTAHMKIA